MKTLKKFIDYLNESKMSKLKIPTDDEIKEVEEYLSKNVDPDWDIKKFGYFYIDVSGKYSVYYTLWRWNPNYYANMNRYISNLSTDLTTAVEKAKKAAGRVPIIIDRYGTQAGLFKAAKAEILTFGKYRGKSLGDIFVEDPKYIMWLDKNYTGGIKEMWDKIKEYKEMYLETIRKKNLEESISNYVGQIGEKISVEADVYNYQQRDSQFGIQHNCKLVDNNGNKYIVYNIGRIVKKGDTIKMTAKVKEHKELLGVKFTVLYYCKISNVFNLEEDMEKYNL